MASYQPKQPTSSNPKKYEHKDERSTTEKKEWLLQLPNDALASILSFADSSDTAAISSTCQTLHKSVNDDVLVIVKQYLYNNRERLGLHGIDIDKVVSKLHNIRLLLRNSHIKMNMIPDPRKPYLEAIMRERLAFAREKKDIESKQNNHTNTSVVVPNLFPTSLESSWFSCLFCGRESPPIESIHETNIKRYQQELKEIEQNYGPFDITIESEIARIDLTNMKAKECKFHT